MINLLIKYGADIKERRYMVVKWAVEHGKLDVIKFLMEKMRQLDDPNIKDPALRVKFINDWIHWCGTSDKIDDAKKKETTDFLEQYK
jgi:hypothetical protein